MTTTGRPPKRSERYPAKGATRIGIPVQGSIRNPASVGECPRPFCRNWLSRKIDPNIPRNISRLAALIPRKARLRNSRIGSIGFSARMPWRTNRASSAVPAVSPVRTTGSVHPWLAVLTRA